VECATPEQWLARAREARAQGELLQALQAYDQILRRGAADHAVCHEAGVTLAQVGEHAQALGLLRQALRLAPDEPAILHDLGVAHFQLGECAEAVRLLRRAAAGADAWSSWASLATLMPGNPEASHADVLWARRAHAARLKPGGRRPAPRRQALGALRVGYLSSSFDRDNYMKPVWGLIAHHDRDAVDVQLFVDGPERAELGQGALRARDRVHFVGDLDNDELRERIGSCDIDLLVDLNGYGTLKRLELFASPPAPRTVGWFNHYATAALPGIDALIGDGEVFRRNEARFYAEPVFCLPQSYLSFDVRYPVPAVSPAPCAREPFTFGSLVALYKMTPPVLDAWAAILRRAAQTRLLLAGIALRSLHNRRWLLDRFADRGVAPDRLEILGPCDHATFLRHYDRIDLALDAFPYNGGTTTMEALYQGVSVLTLEGDRWASRTSQSLLRRAGLESLVAHGPADYVERAVRFACDADARRWLSERREQLRERLVRSLACDTKGLARGMERLYSRVWRMDVR